MRKQYNKPSIIVERFTMDIDIMNINGALSPADIQKIKDTFWDQVGWELDPDQIESAFQIWLDKSGYDTGTSGLCYHLVGNNS